MLVDVEQIGLLMWKQAVCMICSPLCSRQSHDHHGSKHGGPVLQINDAQLGGGALAGARYGLGTLGGEAGPGSAHLAGSGAPGVPPALR